MDLDENVDYRTFSKAVFLPVNTTGALSTLIPANDRLTLRPTSPDAVKDGIEQ